MSRRRGPDDGGASDRRFLAVSRADVCEWTGDVIEIITAARSDLALEGALTALRLGTPRDGETPARALYRQAVTVDIMATILNTLLDQLAETAGAPEGVDGATILQGLAVRAAERRLKES